MTAVRVIVYAVLGAAVAAAALFAFQLYAIHAAHASIATVPWRTLLVDVMDLPTYAGFGAVVGAILAPFPARGQPAFVRLLGWTLAGAALGVTVSFLRLVPDLGHIPTFAEASARFALDVRYVIAGAATGLILSWIEAGLELLQRLRLQRRLARGSAERLNDVDATLKEYWRQRADSYLASRDGR